MENLRQLMIKMISNFTYLLAIFIIASASIFGFLLFFVEVPEKNKRLVEMFCDVYLFAGASVIIQYYFGSSKSSRDKDDSIKNFINTKSNN